MSSETASRIIERWGFPVLVALAAGWVLRNDVLVPLVEEHRAFVRQLGNAQGEIGKAMNDQTRILDRMEQKIEVFQQK